MPDTWEHREPPERDDWHSQTQPVPAVPQAVPPGPEPGQRHAPPRHASWPAEHKTLTAVFSLGAIAVIGAGVFALVPSGPGSPGTDAAAVAGVTASGRAPDHQAGDTSAAQPAADSPVTGTGATARAGVKVTAVPGTAASPPTATRAARSSPAASASTTLGTTPVSVTYSNTTAVVTTSPPPTPPPPPPTCTVTDNAPDITATITAAEAGPATESFEVDEYGPAGAAGPVTQIYIAVPGPLTAGTVVTGDGPTNTAMDSCGVVSVSGNS
ncbi:MAG TPA: hypothetical protein VHZ03_38165 [Trebonia sp.]|jgi:hypothetical protein|nr:hypothetical protein [Trebonia sp.]